MYILNVVLMSFSPNIIATTPIFKLIPINALSYVSIVNFLLLLSKVINEGRGR